MSTIINNINNIFPAGGSPPEYQTGPISLSSSDILNLSTTPKLLIAAPGSGFANIPLEVLTESSTGTAYSGGGNLTLVNGSGVIIIASNSVVIGLAGSSVVDSASTTVTASTYTNMNNQAIYLKNPNTAYSGGTQTAKVWVRYLIIPLV